MQHSMTFTKLSGAGNDFILIDAMKEKLPLDPAALARALCSRPFGVGADGLLLLEPSPEADFLMRYYNADGSYGGMCGNGGRCIAMAAHTLGYAGETMRFRALDHIYTAKISGGLVRLGMKDPSRLRVPIQLAVSGRTFSGGFVDTGSPHAVFLAEDLDELDVAGLGRRIRFHPDFAPAGANANFIRPHGPGRIQIRTYERGVEAETLACGTGSVASAVVGSRLGLVTPPVEVQVRSGEVLTVDFRQSDSSLNEREVVLEGSAHILFHGRVLVDDTSYKLYPLDL